MFRLRPTTDRQPRAKKGAPAQSTTGLDRTSSIQFEARPPSGECMPNRCPPISSANTGSVKTSPIQNRRFMSTSSGLGPDSAVTSAGSSVMPQIGQVPGPTWRISGCIGQV
jgi:hypothetical protein